VRFEWDVEPVAPAPPPPGPVVAPPPVVTPEKPVVVPPVVTTPGPSTPPPVLKGEVFLLAVYDASKSSSYTPAQQAILIPPRKGVPPSSFYSTMTALNISWQPRDINDRALIGEATTETNWKTEALKQGLPCVIAIGQDGTKVSFWTGPLPTDEAAALELGKKITGKP
jgi:hypothetical protein